MQQPKTNNYPLRISHQSEILLLKQELAALKYQLSALTNLVNNNKLTSSSEHSKLKIKTDDTICYLSFQDIIYCRAEGNYTNIVTVNRTYFISKTIKKVIELLDENFIRCHQSYLIHFEHIDKIDLKESKIQTNTSEYIPISRRLKKEVIERFNCLNSQK